MQRVAAAVARLATRWWWAVLVLWLVLAGVLLAVAPPFQQVATFAASAFLGENADPVEGSALLAQGWPDDAFTQNAAMVALGADYNIYLMSRVREEAETKPTRRAVADATRSTGAVITSAGLILAGTFAALMAAEVQSLVQMGFATTTGILLDTFVVRTLLVPSLATLFGRHNLWPSRRAHQAADSS